jgi:hypothetical protein
MVELSILVYSEVKMNRRNLILVVITAFMLLTALVVSFGRFLSGPALIVHLRCEGEVSGILIVVSVPKNGEPGREERFDLKTVCGQGEIEIGGYRSEESLQFTLELSDGETIEVIAEYGRDIQCDQNAFYTVLKITDTPPFIANDRI